MLQNIFIIKNSCNEKKLQKEEKENPFNFAENPKETYMLIFFLLFFVFLRKIDSRKKVGWPHKAKLFSNDVYRSRHSRFLFCLVSLFFTKRSELVNIFSRYPGILTWHYTEFDCSVSQSSAHCYLPWSFPPIIFSFCADCLRLFGHILLLCRVSDLGDIPFFSSSHFATNQLFRTLYIERA